jgi:hypothetical protein
VTPAELPAYLRRLAAEVKERAALDAADAMAQTYQSAVVRSMKGPSPSAPGTPPARRSGTLARSVRAEPAKGSGGRATSSVAPHTVYARIQQAGGDIYPVRAKVLRWKAGSQGGKARYAYAKHVYLPPRPYMVMTGSRRSDCRDAAIAAVRKVVREALGG